MRAIWRGFGIFAALAAFLAIAPAEAQVGPSGGSKAYSYCYVSGPITSPASWTGCPSTISTSIAGFPGSTQTTGTPISVTTGGVTGTLPTGTVVVASNVGTTNNAYCKLGASATTSDQLIAPNSWFAFTVGSNTQLTCITSTSTTTVNMVGGSGIPTGAGGGGGAAGGGGAITMASGAVASGAYSSGSIASGAMVDLGSQADAACGTATGTCSLIALQKYNNSATASAIPAGSAIIGKVGIDQTTPGTTNAVFTTNWPSTVDTNSGNKSASTPRSVIATDQLALAAWGHGATGAAAPAGATQIGATTSGATGGFMKGLIQCDNHVFKHITSATDTLAVQGVASQTIYICGWRARAAGVATWYLENTASTNANCSSTLTQITGVATEAANTGEVAYNPIWGGLKNTSGNGLCINSTGTGGVDIDIWYTQF